MASRKLIDTYIYFYHLDKFCVLPDYPESVSDTMPTSFQETNALARTAPVFSYNNSGPRTVTITLQFHRDMMNDLNRNVSNLKDNVVDFSGDDYIDTLIKYLQAASLPKYNEYSSGAKTVIPPMVAVRFGNSIFIKGVINSSVQVTYKKPILTDNKYALVEVGFTVYEVEPYDATYVAQQGSFRGLTRTFKNGVYKDTSDSPTINSTRNTSSTAGTSKVQTITATGSSARGGITKTGTGIKYQKKTSTNISTTSGGKPWTAEGK